MELEEFTMTIALYQGKVKNDTQDNLKRKTKVLVEMKHRNLPYALK